MAVTAEHTRWWIQGRTRLVGFLLAVVLLAPVGLLFTQHWSDVGDRRSFAELERDGVEYVVALSRVTLTLTEAQSAAVAGRSLAQEDLARAIDAMSTVDDRLGDRLRVGERWSQLRSRVEQLARGDSPDPAAAYADFGETTDLLLDLYNKLRETSGLIRDADADVYYLQDGAVEELPETIVAAGRLADLVVIGSNRPDREQAAEDAQVSVARVEVDSPAGDLATDLQAALDSTASRTLSSDVLSRHDRFLREKDALLAEVPQTGRIADVDTDLVAQIWEDLHVAAADLFDALIAEIDALIEARVDELSGRQRTAAVTVTIAVLLVAGLVWLNRPGSDRVGAEPARPAGSSATEAATSAAATPEPVPVGSRPATSTPTELADWERYGAR